MDYEWYLIEGINPEPWTSPEVSIIWGKGKPRAQVYKREQLRVYQEALQEEMNRLYPDAYKHEGDIQVMFYFWRNVAEGNVDGRKQHANYADATNLQKATEDALQTVLYANDRAVREIWSVIVDQGPEVEPKILAKVDEYIFLDTGRLDKIITKARSLWTVDTTERRAADTDDLF